MKLFVDTSAWVALADRSDQYHQKSLKALNRAHKENVRLITSDYIIDECLTLIRFRMSHSAAIVFGEEMSKSTVASIVPISERVRFMSWTLFKKFNDKELSFTDCTSFALMQDQKINFAFSYDRHFRECGFDMFG